MVYEYISEGSIPRLSVIYWRPLPDLVGPVRSCRLITIRLVLMYKGMIYCSGANDYVLGQVWQHPNLVNDYSRGQGNVFYRDNTTRFAPHNVMMRGNNVTAVYRPNTTCRRRSTTSHRSTPMPPSAAMPRRDLVHDHGAVWQYDAGI